MKRARLGPAAVCWMLIAQSILVMHVRLGGGRNCAITPKPVYDLRDIVLIVGQHPPHQLQMVGKILVVDLTSPQCELECSVIAAALSPV